MSILPPPYAIDIGERTLKVIVLRRRVSWDRERRVPALVACAERSIPEGWIVRGDIREPDRLAALLRETVRHLGPRRIRSEFAVTVLPEARTYLTAVNGELAQGTADDAALRRILPSVLPVNPDEVTVDAVAVPTDESPNVVAVAAAPIALVEAYAAILARAGLTALALEAEATALGRAVAAHAAIGRAVLAIDCGATRTSAVLTAPSTAIASVTIPVSGMQLTARIASTLDLDLATAERVKRETDITTDGANGASAVLRSALQPLLDGIASIRAFAAAHLPPALHPNAITLTGGGAELPGLDAFLAQHAKLPVDRFTIPLGPTETVRCAHRGSSSHLATAYGLGLLGLDPVREL